MLRSELVKQLNELPDLPVCIYDDGVRKYRLVTTVFGGCSKIFPYGNNMVEHIRITFEPDVEEGRNS
jgi:hypothetical protein